jgi:hypothetical protein
MSTLMLKIGDAVDGIVLQVRGAVKPDGLEIYSVFDLLSGACTHGNTESYARKTFYRMCGPDSEHAKEIAELRHDFKFQGNVSVVEY